MPSDFNLQDYIALPVIFFVGFIASYTDIKQSRIPNWLTFLGILVAVALYIFMLLYNGLFIRLAGNNQYVLESFVNTIIALAVGFFLWKKNLWSAGDAKLFTVFAALLPLHFYSKSYISYFPSFSLLINLFLPLILILITKAFIFGLQKLINYAKAFEIKKIDYHFDYHKIFFFILNGIKLFSDFLFMMALWRGIDFVLRVIFNISIKPNVFLMYFVLVMIMRKFGELKKIYAWLNYLTGIVSLIYVGSFLIYGEYRQLFKTIGVTIGFMTTVLLTRKVLQIYIKLREMYEVEAKDIRRGAAVYQDELMVIRRTFAEQGRGDEFGDVDSGGLKDDQAKMIKELFKDRPTMKIRAYKTFSFAPFLLLSVVIAILTRGSFLNWFGRF